MIMDLCVLLRIFSIACAAFYVIHILLMLFLGRSQGMDKLSGEAELSAKWLRITAFVAPLLLLVYWMGSYQNVQQTVTESLGWFVVFDFIVFVVSLLFRVISVLRLRNTGNNFRSMLGRTAGFMTVCMLLTVVVHFFLQGV